MAEYEGGLMKETWKKNVPMNRQAIVIESLIPFNTIYVSCEQAR